MVQTTSKLVQLQLQMQLFYPSSIRDLIFLFLMLNFGKEGPRKNIWAVDIVF